MRHTIAGIALLLASIGMPFTMKLAHVPIGGLAWPFILIGLVGVGSLVAGEFEAEIDEDGVTLKARQ